MNQEPAIRTGFIRVNPRDLSADHLDELLVGPIADDGMDEGFVVSWVMLGRHRVARVSAFHDSWEGMMQCAHLLRALPIVPTASGASAHPSVEDVIAALKAAGCEDLSRPPRFPRPGDECHPPQR